jgi:hypothetical protein
LLCQRLFAKNHDWFSSLIAHPIQYDYSYQPLSHTHCILLCHVGTD